MFPRRTPYENSPPLRPHIVTVAMPGITAPRAQIARYTATDGVDVLENTCSWHPQNNNDNTHPNRKRRNWNSNSSRNYITVEDDSTELTAEEDPPLLYHATCDVSPRLLHNVIASPEMDEIVYNKCSLNPIHWMLMLKEYLVSWIFSIHPRRVMYSLVSKTNLAGERDQAVCQREIRRAIRIIKQREGEDLHTNMENSINNNNNNNMHGITGSNSSNSNSGGASNGSPISHTTPERPLRLRLVLFGCSRGATTTFYTSMKLPPELASYVSLVVLEAPFDTLHDVIASSCWFPRFSLWFFRTFCEYGGNEPYSFDPRRVHLQCPIAFILSRKDTRVPNKLTYRLIETVKRECPQIPAVEVLELKHSRHPLMAIGNREDQDAYVAFMERLYDTYCS